MSKVRWYIMRNVWGPMTDDNGHLMGYMYKKGKQKGYVGPWSKQKEMSRRVAQREKSQRKSMTALEY